MICPAVRSTTIAARPLIWGISAIGWVRSQLALSTGTLTCGSWLGIGVGEGDGVGFVVGADRAATDGCGVAVRAVAATGVMSRCGCSSEKARLPSKRATATISSRITGVRRRGGATRRRDERRPRVPRL